MRFSRRDFVKFGAGGLAAYLASKCIVSIEPTEGFSVGKPKIKFGTPDAYAACGTGLNCAGGGGQCGAGLNCAGGGGHCGAGLNCAGGGGQCGAGLNCAGS